MKQLPVISLVALLALSSRASAQLYFDTNGTNPGTGATATVDLNSNNWTTDSTGTSATVGYVSGSDIVFSAGTNGTGLQQVTDNGTAVVDGITVDNGTVSFFGSASPNFSLGAGGITLNSTDGGLTFQQSLGTLNISANQSWNVDTTQGLTVSSALAGTGQTVTLAGTGSGTVLFNGPISGSLTLSSNSTTSLLEIAGDNNSSFTGGLSASAGTITLDHHDSVASNETITLSNGGQLNLANTDGYAGYGQNIVLGSGGGKVSAGIVGSYGADVVYSGTITGGNGLTVNQGDLLYAGGSSNVGTLNVTGRSRLLALNSGILDNNPVVNVNGGTFDTSFNLDTSDAFNVTNGAIEMRDRHTVIYRNITFNGMNNTVGSDDVGGGVIEFASALNITGNVGIALNGNSNSDYFGNTEVHFDSGLTGTGNLTLSNGPSGYSRNYFYNGGNMAGTVTLNNALINLFNGSGNVFGSSTITMNNSSIAAAGGYANYLNDNHIILGTGTNTIDTGGGIGSISAWFTSGAGSVLHIIGGNSTLVGNANASSIGTLDVDSGRLFFFGGNGLNLIANGTVVNVNNTAGNTPYGAGTLDFAQGYAASVNNEINFASGTGVVLRGYATAITLTDANLPTAGTFRAGSDDTPLTSSITLQKGVTLTGDLNFTVNQSSGSSVPVYMQGVIAGNYGISTSAGGDGPGVLYLSGTNTYTGATTVNGGTLVIDGDNSATGSNYVVNGGTLAIGGYGTAVVGADLTLNAASTSAPAVLQVGNYESNTGIEVSDIQANGTTSADQIVGGNFSVSELLVASDHAVTFDGVLGGTGTYQNNLFLDKQGAGTLTLTGTNTYNGGTEVEQGRLAVNGSITSGVQVDRGAEVGGHGSIGGTITGAGAVGPGNSPGILTAQSVNAAAGTSFNFEFTLATPDFTTASASGNDVLHLEAGTPFLAALTSANAINLYFNANGTYEGGFFVNGSDSLTAALAGATFNYYVESTDGTVGYNGNTYILATGLESVVAVDGAAFADGTQNGFTEQFVVTSSTPEPSTYALLGLGVLVLAWLARRKTRFNV